MTFDQHERTSPAALVSLSGKSAMVVGAGQGIGRACALTLAAAGADVAVVDREAERAHAVADEISAIGTISSVHVTDILESAAHQQLVTDVVDAHKNLDVVVTVVGGHSAFAPFVPAHETAESDIDFVLDLNLRYVLHLLRPVLRTMKEQRRGGSIVSIGSISGMVSAPNHSAYGAAKAGIIHLARSITLEYGHHGIRMNVVSPGATVTNVSANALTASERELVATVPLRRLGQPTDIANAVLFFASPLSEYISGQVIAVDGGVLTRYPLEMDIFDTSEA